MAVNQFTYKSDEERFMAYVSKQPNGCWHWTGTIRGGYGRFSTGPKNATKRPQAHRWAYEHWIGPIPDGLEGHHTCHVKGVCEEGDDCLHRRCVNPEHIQPVTHLVNAREGNSGACQSKRTHCPKGHLFDEKNTMLIERKGGGPNRMCRECCRERRRQWYQNSVGHEVVSHQSKTHCPNGHEYTPENIIPHATSAGPNRGRRCRECKLQGVRDWRSRQKKGT